MSLLSKIIEKCVYLQINSYLCQSSLYAKCQSAYRQGYSTETALLRVQNDILACLGQRKEVILILLDLSAAFDTIDHGILLQRLQSRFGFVDTALKWFRSHLYGRMQRVCIGSNV